MERGEDEPEGQASSDEEESSDDDKGWVDELREQKHLLWMEARDRRRQNRKQLDRNTTLVDQDQNQGQGQGKTTQSQPRFFQIKAGEEFRSFRDVSRKQKLQK